MLWTTFRNPRGPDPPQGGGDLKISVVTAVLNRAATVQEALDSVAAQSWQDVEHVVQDGGSTDGTLEILRAQSGTISLESAPDGGLYDAINQGISRCRGDVIGLMQSDDVFAGSDVLIQVAGAFRDPNVQGVYGDLDYVSVRNARVVRRWRAGPYRRALLRRGWMPPHPTLYLRREVFETMGAYDTSYRIAADYEAMLRWLWRGSIRLAYLPQVMVRMRLGGVSNRSPRQILRKSVEDYRALRSNQVGGLGTLALKNTRKIGQFLPARAVAPCLTESDGRSHA
ncbi:glycosyltransferase family 2 protein [Ruegeria sp. HKCCD8929]|uniref:glycosyltransferase family 2 protein n=1 Tax=Ruegeria sp. HKCCD8929 TaxID=2683006 RepID=UPI002111AEBF|nr:glycosyltransferase family 2 protein [Ruegeria sp. HKCCD8929]